MKLTLFILALISFLALKAETSSLRRIKWEWEGHPHSPKDLPLNFTVQKRIYNGEKAEEGQFPYIVFLSITLNNGKGSACGGSIIDHSWILTAAHCTHNAESIEIFYGSTKRGEGQFSHKVGADKIIQHDGYDDDSLENDVALIQTPHVDFTELVDKVELADRDNDYEGNWAIASGWGDASDDGHSPEDLQYADLQILSKDECWKGIGRESDNILCVSTSEGKTIGSGDSGGPLVTHDEPKLVGVSSFTLFTRSSLPAGFSRVSAHRDWIRDHTGID
ncbi:serine protease 1-like [Drosophila innubila]|uniref:serine protease 1-like n=1 Tax=Drosophila innubila TaxID=198719 RepID=UPI00148CC6C0|nr:serine protease 1-like [Drosophila innubila]